MIKATCKICGYEKNIDDKHVGKTFKCPSCTTPVKVEIEQIIEEPKKDAPEVTQNFITEKNIEGKSNFNNKIIIYIVLGFVCLIIFFVFFNKKGSNDNTSYTAVDTVASTNTVTPDEYWKSIRKSTPARIMV